MRIYHNQLYNTLQQGIKPVWLIFGDEPWQKNDALQQIKSHCQQQGYHEIVRLNADDKFDWQSVIQEFQTMSLFASQRIIELELSHKISVDGAKTLLALAELFTPDIVLIIHGAKLDAANSKKKWFTTFEKAGVYLPIYEIEGQHLLRWINQQAKHLQVNIQADVAPVLAELFAGNLPALAQELEKLSLLFGKQLIDINQITQLTIKQAKFNPFQLTDALLAGELNRCVKILDSLQLEGANAGQIIWLLHKEIAQLLAMKTALDNAQPFHEMAKEYKIWDKRKPLYQKSLEHTSSDNLQIALARLADVDLISKTASDFNPFILLADICLSVYHGELTSQLPLNYEYA